MYNYNFRTNTMNTHIIFKTVGDVNGDKVPDGVFLTGIPTASSQFIEDITLVVKDGKTGKLIRVPLSENAGYNPRVFLGDFNGDAVKDIFISIDSGGSGAIMYHYIYSFIDDIPMLIFDFNAYNEEYEYQITYMDNYRVEAISTANNEKYIIDISLRDQEYLNEIYNNSGTLKEPISGFVNPLSGLYPVDFDSDGVYELLAYQKIAGRYNADSLGYFLNTLKWQEDKFTLYNQSVAIWGADM
ncbi:VCBS repeat-containing protein [Clostridium sp.]|uniref:VCBS repeat-containing protein n=1 Tax=Clostridium sp. TaxID=1506 RepID=UPI002FCB611E